MGTDTDESPDADQETKQLEEVTDDDYMHSPLIGIDSFLLNKTVPAFAIPQTRKMYLALTNPPPDQLP